MGLRDMFSNGLKEVSKDEKGDRSIVGPYINLYFQSCLKLKVKRMGISILLLI